MEDILHINSLPDEVLLTLFRYLSVRDLCECSQWYRFTQDPLLWKDHALARFPFAFRKSYTANNIDWKDQFKKRYLIEQRIRSGKDVSDYSSVLYGHWSAVFCLQPIGENLLATAGSDCSIRIWDWKNKTAVHVYEAVHAYGTLGMHYNPQSQRLISGSMHGELKIFDVYPDRAARVAKMSIREMKVLLQRNFINYSDCLEKKDFQERLLSAKPNIVPFMECRKTISDALSGTIMGVHSHNGLVAAGGRSPFIKIWDEETGEEKAILDQAHADSTAVVQLFQNNQRLISCGHDPFIKVWDVEYRKPIHQLRGHIGWVWGLAFDEASGMAVSGSIDTTVIVFDIKSQSRVQVFTDHVAEVTGVWVDWDRHLIYSSSFSGAAKVHDMRMSKTLYTLCRLSGKCTRISATLDGVFVGCFEPVGYVNVINFANGILANSSSE